MKRTILTVIATVVVTLSLVALGAFVVAPALNRDTAMDSQPVADYVEGYEEGYPSDEGYVEGYESDGTTRDPDYWQQQQLDEQRRLRQQQQQQWQQQQSQQRQYQQQQESQRLLEQSRQRMQETQSQMCRNWGGGYC